MFTEPPPSSPPPPPAPPPDDGYPVTLEVRYPEPGELSRLMLFVKWLLILPHTFLLFFVSFGIAFATFCAWWAILFTGRYPRGLFNLIVGAQQWQIRAAAYSSMLVTDRYPPFSFGRPISGGAIAVLVFGGLGGFALVAIYIVAIVLVTISGLMEAGALEGSRF